MSKFLTVNIRNLRETGAEQAGWIATQLWPTGRFLQPHKNLKTLSPVCCPFLTRLHLM